MAKTKQETTKNKKSKTNATIRKSVKKTVKKEVKKAVKKMPIWLIIILIVIMGGIYLLWGDQIIPNTGSTSNSPTTNYTSIPLTLSEDELSFHFLELGTDKTGDSTYIKAGDIDILIDAGAIGGSAPTIENYVNQYCTDGKLEYVIVTHAHTDHYSGFYGNSGSKITNFKNESIDRNGIFYYYEIGTIIDFSRTNNELKEGSNYQKYVDARTYAINKGATHYTAEQCVNQTDNAKAIYQLTSSISMTILDNKYYHEKSNDENDHSVCTLFTQATTEGNRNFLLTGDLEEKGEENLIKLNTLPKVELFKGGHHGSPTSSNDALLNIIQPKHCAVCCCAGSDEYTDNIDNQFPAQAFIDRIAKWTDKVYVTSLAENDETGHTTGYTSQNGNIIARSKTDAFNIECSNNNTLLKDSEWFNREIYVTINSKGETIMASSTDESAIKRKMRTWPNT